MVKRICFRQELREIEDTETSVIKRLQHLFQEESEAPLAFAVDSHEKFFAVFDLS